MRTKLVFVALLALSLTVACSSTKAPAEPALAGGAGDAAVVADMGIPAWYLDPPQEPGKAFYAVGLVDKVGNIALGKSAAEERAKEELAGVLRTKIQSVLKDYMRSTSSSDDATAPPEEEQMIQRVARAIVDESISGATVIKRAFGNPRPDGTYPAFALAKISFDNVATKMHEQAKENMERVRENAEKAFEDMDALLNKQSDTTPKPTQMPTAAPSGK